MTYDISLTVRKKSAKIKSHLFCPEAVWGFNVSLIPNHQLQHKTGMFNLMSITTVCSVLIGHASSMPNETRPTWKLLSVSHHILARNKQYMAVMLIICSTENIYFHSSLSEIVHETIVSELESDSSFDSLSLSRVQTEKSLFFQIRFLTQNLPSRIYSNNCNSISCAGFCDSHTVLCFAITVINHRHFS